MLHLRDFLVSSASLVASQVLTAGVGFLFWVLASRLFTEEAVGLASAVVSALSLIGTLGAAGLGTMLIQQLPQRRTGRLGMVAAAVLASAAFGTVLGLGFMLIAPALSQEFAPLASNVVVVISVAIGAGATAASLVLDQALVGLLRSGLQLARNVVAAITRVALLGGLGLAAAGAVALDAAGMINAWTASIVVSLGAIVAYGALRGRLASLRPLRWDLLGDRWTSALAHHALNLALQVPGWAMPLIAVGVLSARVNAGFFFAWQLLGLATFTQIALSWMYFAAAAHDEESLARWGWVTLRLSLLTALVGAVLLAIVGPFLLDFLGPGYAADGRIALRVLPVMLFPLVVKGLYVTVHRVRDDTTGALLVVGLGAALEMAGAFLGAVAGGLPGLCLGLLIGTLLEAIPMLPTVYHAIVRPQRASTAG